ncbi:MAG: hypothetical protein HKN16_05950, partial [Saprospiraceae bacterium]|nr:hypothetical protein [Saprospiraceae bacterium]
AEGVYTKVRLGNFANREAAGKALARAKAAGFEKCFIVQKTGPVAASPKPAPEKPVVVEKPAPVTAPVEPPPPKAAPIEATPVNNAEVPSPHKYKIRLATYKNTSYFKPEKVTQWGSVERVKRGQMTIMLLAEFDSLGEAQAILPSVRKAGFTTAHIILDQDGDWKRFK